jgi:hypothetical protein
MKSSLFSFDAEPAEIWRPQEIDVDTSVDTKPPKSDWRSKMPKDSDPGGKRGAVEPVVLDLGETVTWP